MMKKRVRGRKRRAVSPTVLRVSALIFLGLITFTLVYALRVYVLNPLPTLPFLFDFREAEFETGEHLSLVIRYHTTWPCKAFFISSSGKAIGTAELSPEVVRAEIRLTENLESLRDEYYVLRIVRGDNVVYEQQYWSARVLGELLVTEWGWDPTENKSVIVAMNVRLRNEGNVPVYVKHIKVWAGNVFIGDFEVNEWVSPGEPVERTYRLWSPTLDPLAYVVSIQSYDWENYEIPRPAGMISATIIAVPPYPVHIWRSVETWEGMAENVIGLERWFGTIRAPVRGWQETIRWTSGSKGP